MPEHKGKFNTNTCTISDGWALHGMDVVWMENEILRIGILPGRGGDIFEFTYKKAAVNLLLHLEKGIRNPARDFPQVKGTTNQFEDYYYGGWQQALPNSPAMRYRGAELGQHGEVWMLPWSYAILKNSPGEIQLKLWARPVRIPICIERVITLHAGSSHLELLDTLTSECDTDLDIMWGQHIAFGMPLLSQGGRLETNATTIEAEPDMPANRRIRPGNPYPFPNGISPDGAHENLTEIYPANSRSYSELAYLSGFPDDPYYVIYPNAGEFGFRLTWQKEIYPYLWLWEERNATRDAPWWGSVFAYALEPWSAKYTSDPGQAIANREWLNLPARDRIQSIMTAGIV